MQVWPGSVHYPDFFSPVTAAYWEAELRAFFALAQYDGARLLSQPALLCREGCCAALLHSSGLSAYIVARGHACVR